VDAGRDSLVGLPSVPQIFPKQTRIYFFVLAGAVSVLGLFTVGAVAYYATPKFWRVGYMPDQPIPFSHLLHVEHLGLDCRHCHNHVEESYFSNVPDTQTCYNCHGQELGNIKAQSPKLAAMRESWATGNPIPWVRLHRVPDYAHFNHAVHVRRGVSCVECHGQINEMEVVYHAKPLSMGWCLQCHRDPGPSLRPADQVTNLSWTPEQDPRTRGEARQQLVNYLLNDVRVHPNVNCSTCHM
jgi:hypothetical protein